MDIKVGGICERDLDLLLLQEFVSAPDFARWLLDTVAGKQHSSVCVERAARSVTQSAGESDLEIVIRTEEGRRHLLMIENKIGASFQPEQARRYGQRGDNYLRHNRWDSYTTLLVAPAAYLEGAGDHGFTSSVSYEQIRDWFQNNVPSFQKAYPLALLAAAVEKATRGYNPVTDEPVTTFWRKYWEYTLEVVPELEMREPVGKPARAGFVNFSAPCLAKDVRLLHKLPHGHVDLQFSRYAAQISELRRRVSGKLDDDMSIARANQSAVIRLKVPKIDPSRGFEDQLSSVEAGVAAARRLLQWYGRHSDVCSAE